MANFAPVKRALLLPLLSLALAALLASCKDDIPLPESGTRRVLVVYMIGENSLTGNAQADLNEIRAGVSGIPDDCSVVVYFDNSRTDIRPQILSYTHTLGETLQYEYNDEVVSSDSTVMLAALRFVVERNPADEYALILWSHGSGWIPATSPSSTAQSSAPRRTIGIDNGSNSTSNTGQQMEIHTLRGVLEELGVKWKYILFDACFMQCVEVAYELRDLTEWVIGTPAETPANGAAYDKMMPSFFSASTYAADITKEYFQEYCDTYGLIISAVRCERLEALARSTRLTLTSLGSDYDYPTEGIQQYCAYASTTGWKPEYFDMGSSLGTWAGEEAYGQWLEALDEAVPYRYLSTSWLTSYTYAFKARLTDTEHSVGVSMYVPVEGRDNYNSAWRTYEWYRDAAYPLDR